MFTWLIVIVLVVAAVVFGVLFGRKNKNIANQIDKTVNSAGSQIAAGASKADAAIKSKI